MLPGLDVWSKEQPGQNLVFQVGRPMALVWDTENPKHLEGNFVVLRNEDGKLYSGYAVSHGKTVRFEGESVESLKYIPGSNVFGNQPKHRGKYCVAVDRDNWEEHFGDCGLWLRFADRLDSHIAGLYHAETNCCYRNNQQTYASIGYTESLDGGLTFSANGDQHPMVPQTIELKESKGIHGLDQVSAVGVGDDFYIYFGVRSTGRIRKPSLVRVPKVLLHDKSNWTKFYDGEFMPMDHHPGDYQQIVSLNPGRQSPNFHGISPAYDTYNALFYLIGPKKQGIYLSMSKNGFGFWRLNEPLIPYGKRQFKNRAKAGELYGNVSIVAPEGGNSFQGDTFYMFYRYSRAGQRSRNFVIRKVSVKSRETTPAVSLMLSQYYSRDTKDTWTTTKLPLRDYEIKKNLGGVLTSHKPGSYPIVDCLRTTGDGVDHMIRYGRKNCNKGEVTIALLGWIYKTPPPPPIRTKPLYRCVNRKTSDYIVGDLGDCKGMARSTSIGYVLDVADQ